MRETRRTMYWLLCALVMLAGCSSEAEKVKNGSLDPNGSEDRSLQAENEALKAELATVKKLLQAQREAAVKERSRSLAVPDGWANPPLHQEELDGFEKPGTYEGTQEVSLPDGNVLRMKQLSKVTLGNGGNCLVNASVETQEGSGERRHALQIVSYDHDQQVYRAVNVFGYGVSVLESPREETDVDPSQVVSKKRAWSEVYSTHTSENADFRLTSRVNEARDEVEWNWTLKEDGEPTISGKGEKRRLDRNE